jgi:agmatine deiminase
MAGLMAAFRMPAEWEPHEATWLAWPHEATDWPDKFEAIPWIYGEIVRRLSSVETVRILVEDAEAERRARSVLCKCGATLDAVEFFRFRTNRSWTRDYCPIFVRDARGALVATNWIFNGWAKYDNYHYDNQAPVFIAEQLNVPRVDPGIVLEGGSIDVNGAGALLTTEECLLSPIQARNPHLTREQLEQAFADYLGINETVWLKNGIAGDDTHGHIDDLARFVNRDTIVIATEEHKSEINYEPLQENLEIVRRTRFRVVTLPMPEPVYFDGQRLPASYANFYIANELVLVPTFNDPHDRIALNTLCGLFPERRVIGVHATDLVLGLGTLHCMTQQQPAPL